MSLLTDQRRAFWTLHPGWMALGSALLLTVIGIQAIATVRPEQAATQWTLWLPLSLCAMVICVFPAPRHLGHASYLLAILTIIVLVFLIAPGVPRTIVPVRNGARRWIQLFGGMSVQPTEFAKIALVMALAWYLRYRSSYRQLIGLMIPLLVMLLPLALILRQPDLGTAMLFVPCVFAMLLAAGAKVRHLLLLAGIGLLIGGLNIAVIAIDPPHSQGGQRAGVLPAWTHVLKPHQEMRIAALFWPDRYEQQAAFQGITAQRMVASGGLLGQGREQARMLLRYNGLPEAHNDMVFAVVVCRWGLLGATAVILLYLVLCGSMLWAASWTREPFARLTLVGFATLLFTQSTINIAMTLGLVPITGLTLPFVSFGGSSLMSCFMMIGLMFNFVTRRPGRMVRPSFEFDHESEQPA